jgi:hypothetical protein
MQGIVVGMTGSSQTTLLKNIFAQDIARLAGPPEDRRHIPMVYSAARATSSSSTSGCRTFIAPDVRNNCVC